MSQLTPHASSSGMPDEQLVNIEIWKSFLQTVLEVTVAAYHAFSLTKKAQHLWEEDTFTINLLEHMRQSIRTRKLPLHAQPQTPIYTDEMRSGIETPRKAVKIDIRMWDQSWYSEDHIYFAWECKLIIDKAIEKKHERLIPEYVTNGIVRFIDENWKYAAEVDDAGMLGYVLYGNVSKIVEAINLAILHPPKLPKRSSSNIRHWQAIHSAHRLSQSDHLKMCEPSPINDFAVYQSHHNRVFCEKDIRLYHLFLSFDFDHKE